MNFSQITKLQKEYGYTVIQDGINSGHVWKMEGSQGREAMRCITEGSCMLPMIAHKDYYGNILPARQQLKAGTKGTFQNSVRFWTDFEENG